MKTIRVVFLDRRAVPELVRLGNEGEHLAQKIKFDLADELRGAQVLLHLQIGEYADVVALSERREFEPTRSHTAHPGRHTAYLEAFVDEEIVWRSDVFYVSIGALPQDGEQLEQLCPTAVEQAMAASAKLAGLNAQVETLTEEQAATVRTETADDGTQRLIFGIPKGERGEKPVKGVDYFTEAERMELVEEVLQALPAAEGEVF